MTRNTPGTTWLITERTRPAWTAVLALLDDNRAHPHHDVAATMRSAGLAPRTIQNHLRSASRRGWIHSRRGLITLRNRQAITAALSVDPSDSRP